MRRTKYFSFDSVLNNEQYSIEKTWLSELILLKVKCSPIQCFFGYFNVHTTLFGTMLFGIHKRVEQGFGVFCTDLLRGHPLMTSTKLGDFLTPSPLCHTKLPVLIRPSYMVSQKWEPLPLLKWRHLWTAPYQFLEFNTLDWFSCQMQSLNLLTFFLLIMISFDKFVQNRFVSLFQ